MIGNITEKGNNLKKIYTRFQRIGNICYKFMPSASIA